MKSVCILLLTIVAAATSYYLPHYNGHYGHAGYNGYLGYHGYPGYLGYGHNHEYDYRQFGGYPVHVGQGQFYFLGAYGGSCAENHNYGFYYAADDSNSFVVCDHGRAHRFQCPKGTKNRDHGYFVHNHQYNFHELCGEHTNQA